MFRTPAKQQPNAVDSDSSPSTAGSVALPTAPSRHPSVRRSIGEWEAGKSDSRSSQSPPNKTFTVGAPKPKPAAAAARLSAGADGNPPVIPKPSDRVEEAKACLLRAKINLSNSRNLKADIKLAVIQAVDRLFQLVKEAVADSKQQAASNTRQQVREKDEAPEKYVSASSPPGSGLGKMMQKHMDLIRDNSERVTALREALERGTVAGGHGDGQAESIGKLLGEVRELRQTTEATEKRVCSLQEAVPSYAEVLARPAGANSPTKPRPKHSIIVSSENEMDTGDQVLGRVREALQAKTSGLQVTRVQKVRNQKVVLSCESREQIEKVVEKINTRGSNLKVEEARNKDPLVIIKNVLGFHKDDEIVACLRTQNQSLFSELSKDEFRALVKYRRRARNPHENHVVLQVSPQVWQRLTVAKRVHVDLQYAAVQDQSPLVQCTRCLGYGHGRRLCTESVDLCSYCAGPHLRADCPAYTASETATCRNCRLAKYPDIGHNAFDGECPVRKRWDAIARSSVAYC